MKTKKQKGSALAYSLIILSLMLVIATGIVLSSTVDRSSSAITSDTVQAIQTANTGMEVVLRDLRGANKINEISGCRETGYIHRDIRADKESYDVAFYDDTNAFIPCDTNGSKTINQIHKVKVMGNFKKTQRNLEVTLGRIPPPPRAGCSTSLEGVSTCAELVAKLEANKNASLCTDIDCSGEPASTFPIEQEYSGTLEGTSANAGEYFMIKNVSPNIKDGNSGFFAKTTGATVKNLLFDNVNIANSRVVVGGIVAEGLTGSLFQNLKVTGLNIEVKGTEGTDHVMVGGAVGQCYKCKLDNVSTSGAINYSGTINGTNYVEIGGVAGNVDRGNDNGAATHNKLHSDIDITHEGNVPADKMKSGALLGYCEKNAEVNNSYSNGSVTITGNGQNTDYYVGGLVGGMGDCTITNSYTISSIVDSNSGNERRGVVGYDQSLGASYDNVFWKVNGDINQSGCTSQVLGCPVRTDAQLKNPATYSGWDSGVWSIINGQYPCLKNVSC